MPTNFVTEQDLHQFASTKNPADLCPLTDAFVVLTPLSCCNLYYEHNAVFIICICDYDVCQVKRKLELDDIAEFKAPVSKSPRSSCITKDLYISYTGDMTY